ncbi:MAG TPA: NADH-quinone oxidoreductase subunit M [Aggregatilineales bacterium]|nr:NADH-quinone oxidoreductase subunit M [Anaerolineales bacterium]HRE47147.1 NADH-quinone oxidoreductase subunit M [Aggregatilineales bacterium]
MLLTAILIIPTLAAFFILFLLKDEQKTETRLIAAFATATCLVLSALVYIEMMQPTNIAAANTAALKGLSFFVQEVNIPWLPALGISYHVGADGISAPMVLLTGLAAFGGVLISWKIEHRLREFMAFFLLLVVGVYGVFVSLDVFLLFFWYEFAIFPMYFLIAGWGWKPTREYAAMKLTLYILIGSFFALIGLLVMYFSAGSFFSGNEAALATLRTTLGDPNHPAYSFSFQHFEVASRWQQIAGAVGPFDVAGSSGVSVARFWFPMVFIGFGVLAGMFPFHNWSPDGHVAAPTAVSMIHAGVLMKLGAYAALRIGVQLLPEGAKVHLPWIILLTAVNVVYGAFIAYRQRDFKYVIGFSSVSHMGLVMLGISTMNLTGLTGAGLQMFSHGVMTAMFFSCVGMVYDRAHTRDIPSLGGFGKVMPFVAFAFILGGLVSMGMPGFSGFIAEFPIFTGLWHGPVFAQGGAILNPAFQTTYFPNFTYYTIIAIVCVVGIILTAGYVLRVVQLVFFGEFNKARYPDVGDVTIIDKSALVLLGVWLVILGVYPQIMTGMLQAGMSPIVKALGG